MTNLTGNFYTTDFDQEMLDFIKNTYPEVASKDVSSQDAKLEFCDFSDGGKFWTSNLIEKNTEHLTKQQFKERIGMIKSNEMPELIAGRHFVVTEGGSKYLVLGDDRFLIFNGDSPYDMTVSGWHIGDNIGEIVTVYDSFIHDRSTAYDTNYAILVWRKQSPVVELTLEQIADKMGVPVSSIRIRD